jgi:hypothetical protein
MYRCARREWPCIGVLGESDHVYVCKERVAMYRCARREWSCIGVLGENGHVYVC